jgi:hypothetical protein
MERFGLRANILLGAFLNLLCGWVRYGGSLIAKPSAAYGVVMLGQVLGALGQPLFTQTPTRVANIWFAVSERDLATVFCSLTNPVGNALGSVVPTLNVNGPSDVPAMLLYQAIAGSVVMLLTLLLVRSDKPPTPPSASAALREISVAAETKKLQASLNADEPEGSPTVLSAMVPSQPVDDDTAGSSSGDATRSLLCPPGTGADHHHHGAHSHASASSIAIAQLISDFKALLRNRNFLKLNLAFVSMN